MEKNFFKWNSCTVIVFSWHKRVFTTQIHFFFVPCNNYTVCLLIPAEFSKSDYDDEFFCGFFSSFVWFSIHVFVSQSSIEWNFHFNAINNFFVGIFSLLMLLFSVIWIDLVLQIIRVEMSQVFSMIFNFRVIWMFQTCATNCVRWPCCVINGPFQNWW